MSDDEIEVEGDDEGNITYPPDYDVISTPNDFNISTLFNYMTQGTLELPTFQRYYVWDLKRASKFIESLIMGLPVPQIFLYEYEKGKFFVIDGQQRLSTIYYFVSKRFPRQEKIAEIRDILDEKGELPKSTLSDNAYFTEFDLSIESEPGQRSRLEGENYDTLGEGDKKTLGLRTIRTITIRQIKPENDDSIMYEIFSRLNSGGINLKPQELRASAYHSKFLTMLTKINLNKTWRRMLTKYPDKHMKDIETILRGFAMLVLVQEYKPSMVKFLNKFSKQTMDYPQEKIDYFSKLFEAFMKQCESLPDDAFKIGGKLNVSLYDAVFCADCEDAYKKNNLNVKAISYKNLNTLKNDKEFRDSIESGTSDTEKVKTRLRRAKTLL
jgi:uncharacterized protein with ParB-like and HNH nuclease domain